MASTIRQRKPQERAQPKANGGPVKTHQVPKSRPYPVILVAVGLSVLLVLFTRRNSLSVANYAVCSRTGQTIYTVDVSNTVVQCIVVSGSDIVATGTLDSVRSQWTSPGKKPLDIRYIPKGSIVVPGMSDSHAHILEYGASKQLDLEGTKTIEETVKRIRNYVLGTLDVFTDEKAFIYGSGWDQTAWPSGGLPTYHDLESDPILRGRRIVLQSKDYHGLWVSKAVLDSIPNLPDEVNGGVLVRDSNGKPTGVFLDEAQSLIDIPQPTEADLIKQLGITARDALTYGITSIHDAGLKPVSLDFFKRQADSGNLPIRIYAMRFFNETDYWGSRVAPVINAGKGRLNARSVKMFADGALRTGGAALYEPYSDNPSTNGFMRISPELFHEMIPKFLQDGWQVNVHAIGDRANGIVLDAFESALGGVDVSALRPRIEHAQMMTKRDMKRLGQLGVIASIQPTHVISDMLYAEERLGPERVKMLYAFRDILDSGARLAIGSDFPVETMNPFYAFYAAITRLSADGTSPHGPEGWFPNQRLTRIEALRGLTIDPAYASFTDSTLGSLEVGKKADFAVLSQDIMKVSERQILKTKVLATTLDGQIVHGKL